VGVELLTFATAANYDTKLCRILCLLCNEEWLACGVESKLDKQLEEVVRRMGRRPFLLNAMHISSDTIDAKLGGEQTVTYPLSIGRLCCLVSCLCSPSVFFSACVGCLPAYIDSFQRL
jgi:hypothetical protein